METYFNINFEFDKKVIFAKIDESIKLLNPSYICVCDGVVLSKANSDRSYLNIINTSIFSICDSSYIPIYLKWIYGIERSQYSGSDIFVDIIKMQKYRMLFMGTSMEILYSLKENLSQLDKQINQMTFYELPFCNLNDFNYASIAKDMEQAHAEIIWIALGAPKQEIFMNNLMPYLKKGVMIAVGAVFKFHANSSIKRAPQWMINLHLEFFYRLLNEPKKQLKRCAYIIQHLPLLLYLEWKRKFLLS
jgi:N-acetylglucosaminyldiphosphoundecaprenol N-acetyl-beta-D-mannosaminyltransferase